MRQKQRDASVIQDVSEWGTDKLDWFYGEKDLLAFVWFYTERIPSRIVLYKVYYTVLLCLWLNSQVPFYADAAV